MRRIASLLVTASLALCAPAHAQTVTTKPGGFAQLTPNGSKTVKYKVRLKDTRTEGLPSTVVQVVGQYDAVQNRGTEVLRVFPGNEGEAEATVNTAEAKLWFECGPADSGGEGGCEVTFDEVEGGGE